MIHVGLPVPTFVRLHIRAQIALQQATRNVNQIRFSIRLANSRLLERAASALAPRRVARRPANSEVTVNEFVVRYDDLIDLLCWAANEGVKDQHRVKYANLRAWFVDHYEHVRPELLPYMPQEPDRARALCDPFESLFIPVSLDAVVNSDSVIDHIQTTRNAVETYRDQAELVAA